MERTETIFEQVLELAPAERAEFLERECAGDSALHELMQKLVGAHERADRLEFLQINLVPVSAQELGDRIHCYKLLEKIGEGGWGVVYVAEQTEPVRRRVALKVIKLGMDTKQVVARFAAERQALAMMDHPNIAKVFDAGATDTGRLYFVMELVRGSRITDYCDDANLNTQERLHLFIKVCQAIQHAHQKGIIHRDIKPSNILVSLHDGIPVPKVIDFGIAKATEGRLTDATIYTQFHQFMGTPAYMSPEQAEMSGMDIDTRSDIYSLGVLLYELLAGSPPFDAKVLMALGLDAMRKTICEKEPPRPSTRVTQDWQRLGSARVSRSTFGVPPEVCASDSLSSGGSQTDEVLGESRQTTRATRPFPEHLRTLISALRGDLDWIVMKCLEKDRSRRYDTANGLAMDLNRYLHNEPVGARPPTPLYRFQKTVRRNKLVFASAGAVVTALLVGLFLALWQAIRASNAEQFTRRNAYAAEINVAFHALDENNLDRARELLHRQRPRKGEEDLRGFEWRYLWQLCQGDEFATFRDEGAWAAAFSPDGKFLAYSGGKIIVREAASLKEVVTLPGPAETLSFAPHTNLLASGSGTGVKLWDTETWREVRLLTNTTYPSLFSPDGRWLLTGVDGAFRVWDTRTWQPAGDCPGAPQAVFNARNAVAFSPDCQFLVTVAGQNAIGSFLRAWRLPGLEEDLPELRFERGRPASVAFSKDGKHLLTGLWDGRLVIQEFATRKSVATLKEHAARIAMVAVSPDGKTMATASSDQTMNLWDATTFEHLVRLRGHIRSVMTLAFSTDSRTIVSGGNEGMTKLWHTGTRHTYPAMEGPGLVAGFTSGGRQLVAVMSNRWCVWTPESGARVDFPTPTSRTVITSGKPSGKPYDVNPDEPLGALGRVDGAIEIWHLNTGALHSAWPAHDDGIGAVAFSPDGKRLATGSIKGEVKIWDFATQQEVGHFGPVDAHLFCLAFSPDGKTVAASGRGSNVWLWTLSTPDKIRQLPGHAFMAGSVAFSPDGTLVATPSLGGEVRLWELRSGGNTITLKGHVGGTTAAAFSPDGKTLATAGTDIKVKLWNIATQQELATFPMVVEFPTLSFSRDGRMLAVGEMTGDNRRIQILYAASFEEIAVAEAE